MTRYDHQFAMAAMQGLLTSGESWNYNTIGRDSYDIADAMLAEREKDSVDSVTDAKAQLIRAIELEHNITVFEHLCIVHLIHCLRFGFVPKKEDV
jgi:hypothetical protein